MARFVFVHGAWHGAWCFAEVIDALRTLGDEATAVDLPCDRVGLTQHDYAAIVGPQPGAVLVGHSLGCQTIPHVEARMRIYVAGLLPVDNVDVEAFAPGFGGTVRDELDRSYWPDADTCAARLYPDCSRSRADWAYAQLRRQARIRTEAAPFGAGDVVVATLRDAAIEAAWQVETGRRYGARVVELDAGHSPFFTQPDELALLLHTLA